VVSQVLEFNFTGWCPVHPPGGQKTGNIFQKKLSLAALNMRISSGTFSSGTRMKSSRSQPPKPLPKARPGAEKARCPEAHPFEAVWKAAGQVFYQCEPHDGPMRLLGASEALLGKVSLLDGGRAEWLDWVHPDDQAAVARLDADAAAAGKPRTFEYRFLAPSGRILWLRETRVPGTGGGFSGTLEDVTRSREMAAQLRHRQKQSVFGECARGIAHDFNNVLAVFQGYTELLQLDAEPGSDTEEYLAEMMGAVGRARKLTAQIHRVSHARPEHPVTVNLATVLRDLKPLFRKLGREGTELVVAEKSAAAWVRADVLELETLILNLVANACEAMPGGGRLEVSCDAKGANATLAISDTGEGIADVKRIFEPGFTTRLRQRAEGMGLAVCREIAANAGGRITCKSKPGKGSEFKVMLPLAPAPARSHPAENRKIPPGRGEGILIAEDDPSVRKALAETLKRIGYRVWQASNGEEAVRLLSKETKIRLVISDYFMPIMTGGELVESIQSRWPGIPMILISGYPAPTSPDQNFLPKPLATSILAQHIRKLIDV
jgi:signal transduction histidine kinase